MIEVIARFLCCFGFGVGATLSSRTLFHYFQLESYQFPGYYKTMKRNSWKGFRCGLMLCLVALMLWAMTCFFHQVVLWIWLMVGAVLLVAGGWGICCFTRDAKIKKKFAITPRVKRLYAVSVVMQTLLVWGLSAVIHVPLLVLLAVFALLLPITVALSGLVAWPIEKGISEMYFRDAQRILKNRPDLIKIGITGSYGKTSVKFILGTLLSEKYQTLVTPSSFNTPMGVTKIIRTKLTPAHQVFVAEMGARHVGDIKELCRLVHPRYGVLTSVGPQHLDTFKTLERIKTTKYELMDAIPENGVCFFPNDGGICLELYNKTSKSKRICSIRPDKADVWVEEVQVGSRGSSFTLCTADERIACQTCLLGEHNIQNIVLAATVCVELGLTLRQIAHGIARIAPIEHRLQLVPTSGGLTIIDDAFNSNPNGAAKAVQVLKAFPQKRIIITPGMVELGEKEAEYNRTFGEQMASCVDVAILVGKKHTAPIREGLLAAGFDDACIHSVASLDEAAVLMRQLAKAGDTVLFENDLPDHYSE